jgi:hypothetical protein
VIVIAHTHAEGTLVHGTVRGDGTNLVITSVHDGWRFSHNLGTDGAWYLPHSQDRNADRARIQRLAAALRDAGHPVEVDIDDTPRPTVAVEADRAERAAGRAARYTELADTRHTDGHARLDHVRERRAAIPLGQPVISPRYASFLHRLGRADDAARAEIDVGDHWQRRAQAAESTQRYRHNPRIITRRIERLEADLRRWQRARDTVASGGLHGEYADGGEYAHTAADYLARAHTEIARLDEQIRHWRGVLAEMDATGVYRPWTREHFRAGDEALILGTWYPVVRVNAKSLTVPPLILLGQRRLREDGKDVWTDTAPYDKVHGRRRDRKLLHTPPPPPKATCTCPITISTTSPAPPSEREGGRCTKPAVARLTIRHDGTSCGCNGLCLITDPAVPDEDDGQPWTEVILLCADHDHDYRPTEQATDQAAEQTTADTGSAAVTYEELS